MIKIVLDTNIIISAAITPNGNPAKIIKLVSNTENMIICYNPDIIDEYVRVLSYERLNFSAEKKIRAINVVWKYGILTQPIKSTMPLPDESDRIFYDTAKAVDAYLITGNIKHYPEEPHILTPAKFIEMFEN